MACSRPLIIEGQKIACRSCDYCVSRRVRAWCVRAMMEKAMSPHTFVVALSYSEETEHARRSARMFDYQDVSDFLKRLRRQMDYHLGAKGALSFVAAGEQGDRYQRCHWHLVLFAQVDFLRLGEWKAPWGVVTDRSDIVSPKPTGAKSPVWRRTWSLWDHGFVTVQEPDYGGMRYAMAYALKDQFNVRNSSHTARQGKAEVFGTGYLAMSKKPPIGARFIDAYVEQCAVGGFVPPTRKLTVPGVDRPFWPSGMLADRLLGGLASVNAGIKDRTGVDAAGWSSLLYEARDSEADLERLGVLDVEESEESEGDDEGRQAVSNTTDNAEVRRRARQRRRCGSTEACDLCLRGRNLDGTGIYEVPGGFARECDAGESDPAQAFRKRQRDGLRKGPNPLCGLYAESPLRAGDYASIFPASAGR